MILCLFLLSLIPAVLLSQIIVTTIPSSETDPIYLITSEGDDVSLYCAVFNNGPALTIWWYQRANESTYELITIINGELTEPKFLVGRIDTDGMQIPSTNLTFRTNFTILNFTSDLDLISFQCGPPGTTKRFTIGLPGKRKTKEDAITFSNSYSIAADKWFSSNSS